MGSKCRGRGPSAAAASGDCATAWSGGRMGDRDRDCDTLTRCVVAGGHVARHPSRIKRMERFISKKKE